ncbi:PACRG-like protein isoform X2 [Dreissena polymorpha]|uniref:PACRG-like protein isoform X2 n=1 Tax=Dreissena polymorpha TaxID=45954 RepID=UPI002263E246|nr:PACRG-like protein isoform X2 [Dreissena polymorpha]
MIDRFRCPAFWSNVPTIFYGMSRFGPKKLWHFSSSTKNQSAFAAIYSNGGIPCRLVHGSVKHKLAWNTPPEQVAFDPVLVTLAEGLCETIHPYMFVARTGFKEMLEVPNCDGQVVPLLPRLTVAIRNALGARDSSVVLVGLEALIQLSEVVGPALNPHLNKLLVPVAKGMMDKKLKEKVVETLQVVEKNGGRDCLPLIKSKIPTYSSIFT